MPNESSEESVPLALLAPPIPGPVRGSVPPPERSLAGIGLALLANLCFATSDALLKHLAGSYPVFQVNVMQGTAALVPLLGMLLWKQQWRSLNIRHPWLVLVRGALGGLGGMLGLTAFSQLPLADVYAIVFATPILVTLLSIPILGEKVRRYRWTAVLVGFGGVLVMVQPGRVELGIGHLAALGCVVLGSTVILIIRGIARDENRLTMVTTVVAGVVVINLVPAILSWVPPRPQDLGLAACSGVVMLTAQFLIIRALQLAPAAAVAPMQYSMMIWALLFGVFAFGDPVRTHVVLGAAIVTASSLYIMHRERVRARDG